MNMKSLSLLSALAFSANLYAAPFTVWDFNDASPIHTDGTTTSTGTVLLGTTPGPNASIGTGTWSTTAQAGTAISGGNTYRIGLGSLSGASTTDNLSLVDNALAVQGGFTQAALNTTSPNNNGSYIQFSTSTIGLENISFSYISKVTFSSVSGVTGFRQQVVSYSVDGTNFTNLTTYNNTSANVPWATTGTRTVNLSSIPAVNNIPSLTVRITLLDAGGYNNTTGVPANIYNGNNRFDNVTFDGIPAVPKISGFLTLQNTADDGVAANEQIGWTLTNGTNTYNGTIAVADFGGGNYSLNIPAAAPNGPYTIFFKGGTFLGSTYNVNLNGSSISLNASLRNGDVDQDTEVGPGDFELVVAQFGEPGSADLDNNGEVGPSDFEIIVTNFSLGDL